MTSTVHPFRFIAPMPPLALSFVSWRDSVRRIEDLGFSTVSISEHLTHGWAMEPLIAMAAAAATTDRLRVLSLLLANDYRHPVLLHKAAATLDVLSEGRLELGLGAGWLADDYAAAGIPMDPPAVRIARLEEALTVLRGLFGAAPLVHDGPYYHVAGLDGLPKPVQQPHPPIMVGGGGRRVLSLAARQADIVGVHCQLPEGRLTAASATDLGAEAIAEKVSWVREAASAAGRSLDTLELQFSVYLVRLTGTVRAARASVSSFAGLLAADPALIATSPSVLAGTPEQCVDLLQERRELYGFSYLGLGSDLDAVAPIVRRLAGT